MYSLEASPFRVGLFTKIFKPTPSYYSGDIILKYDPIGVLPIEILRDNIRNSIMYYKDNVSYVDSLHYLNPLRG